MKLIDKYSNKKKEYYDKIILLNSGTFYVTFKEDSLIMNYLFFYQIKNGRIGFPKSSLNKVIDELNEKNIDYVLLEDDKIVREEVNKNNKYNSYFNKAQKQSYDDMLNKALLERIDFLLKNNRDNYNKIKEYIDEF